MNSQEIERQRLLLAIERKSGVVAETPPIFTIPGTAPDDTTTDAGLIDNQIDNSDFDYSKDGYLNTVPVGGDAALECYNFYRNRLIKVTDVGTTNASPTISSASGPFKAAYTYPMSFVIYGAGASGNTLSGTLTRVSDTGATLSTNALATLTNATLWFGDTLAETSAKALKATGHSLFATNEGTDLNIPEWEKTNGWVELGSLTSERWSIDTPLPLNIVRPGLTIFALCIISVRVGTAALPDGVKTFFGVWDATASQNRWLEGGNFNLDAAPAGTVGSTTVSYKAIGHISDGSTIESNVKTITNSNAVLSASNYNRLTWTNAPGILDFTLYRLMGGVYKRIFTITNGASDFNDTGGFEATVSGFPETFNTKALVYKETGIDFPVENSWIAMGALIPVPSTYNTQNTTGKQWFRYGVVDITTDNRSILLDRIGLSFRQGGWNRSSRDRILIATNNPSSSPTGSGQGGVGIEPCFEGLTLVRIAQKDGVDAKWLPISQTEKGQYIWDGARKFNRITRVHRKTWPTVYLVVLENGAWARCTGSERFVTSRADKEGTRLDDMTIGDTILSPVETGVSASPIIILEEQKGEIEVFTLTLQNGQHIFVAGNHTPEGIKCLLAHNRKELQLS